MAKPIVYRIKPRYTHYRYESGLVGKFEHALKKIDLGSYIGKDEVVPLKMHLGSHGAFRPVRPQFVRMTADAVRRIPAKPFITDSARPEPYEYLEIANHAGYNALSLNAPVIIADGIYGKDTVTVEAGRLLKNIAVPSAIHDAASMIVLTHVKGHIAAVLGGAIKNVAMGCVARFSRDGNRHHCRGRIHMLMGEHMHWNAKKCSRCFDCVAVCPVGAVSFPGGKEFTISDDVCWNCGRCSRVCRRGAITVPTSHEHFQEALAESATAVLATFKKKKVLYINFLLDMQPECDCMPVADPPVAQDEGILISDDIAAIDMATLDILTDVKPLPGSRAEKLPGKKGWDIFSLLHKKDGRRQILHAEKLGAGSSTYRLVELG